MPRKSWPEFFASIARIMILLILLAVVLPKLVSVCSIWISARGQDERKPSGNPMRVEEPYWSRYVLQLLPNSQQR